MVASEWNIMRAVMENPHFVRRIPIEQRPALEACLVRGALYPFTADASGVKQQATVMVTPEGLDGVYNPSFDVTPAELITATVTSYLQSCI